MAATRAQQPLLLQALQHDRRRRKRQRHPDGKPGSPVQTGEDTDGQRNDRRDPYLQPPQTHDRTSHLPDAIWLQLESDQEQHEDHAEFSEMQHVLSALRHETQSEWADGDTGQQVAEDGTEPKALGQRHGDDSGGQVDDGLFEKGRVFHQSCVTGWTRTSSSREFNRG